MSSIHNILSRFLKSYIPLHFQFASKANKAIANPAKYKAGAQRYQGNVPNSSAKVYHCLSRSFTRMEALTFGVPQAHSVGIVVGTSKKKARKQLDVKGRHSLNRIYSETFMQVIAEYPELNDLTFKKLYYTDKFNEIRVVWLGFDDERDEKAKKVFDEKFHVINKQMSDLLMGSIVPPLKFISERTNNILSKIEKRLQEADFGPDYVPGSQSPLNLGSTAKESVSMIKEEDMPKWKRMYIKRHKLDIPLKSDLVD